MASRLTLPLENTVDEIALVEAAVGPLVSTTSVLFALVVLALEADLALLPRFRAHAMLMVVHPVTLIRAAFRVYENPAAIRHPIPPLALIHASIRLYHASEALHLTLDELPLILGAVRPDKYAQTILNLLSLDKPPKRNELFRRELGDFKDDGGTYH